MFSVFIVVSDFASSWQPMKRVEKDFLSPLFNGRRWHRVTYSIEYDFWSKMIRSMGCDIFVFVSISQIFISWLFAWFVLSNATSICHRINICELHCVVAQRTQIFFLLFSAGEAVRSWLGNQIAQLLFDRLKIFYLFLSALLSESQRYAGESDPSDPCSECSWGPLKKEEPSSFLAFSPESRVLVQAFLQSFCKRKLQRSYWKCSTGPPKCPDKGGLWSGL